MLFRSAVGNNKYYTVTITMPAIFQAGDVVQYYLRIPYDDHDPTFVHRSGDGSTTTESEAIAQGTPFAFTIEDAATKGRWGAVFQLPNVAIPPTSYPAGEC